MRSHLVVIGLMVLGCGPSAGTPDAAPADASVEDAGTDAGGPTDCGDGVRDADERCDGETIACSALGPAWSSGTARCRASCDGWDVATCERGGSPDAWAFVRPRELDPARFDDARCNDGTPFDFRVRLSPTGSRTWVVWLQGGVFCDDESVPCDTREMGLISTSPQPSDRLLELASGDGILSTDALENPLFADANLAVGHYCSSDFWAGATSEPRPTSAGEWYFTGHANVAAMLDVLSERYGLHDGDGTLAIAFGGSSAGAMGTLHNAAEVVRRFPSATQQSRLKLAIDAGFMTPWDDPAYRVGASTLPDIEVIRRARAFAGATYDLACEAGEDDPATCFYGHVAYPYLRALGAPIYVQQAQLDTSFAGLHGIEPADVDARTRWQAATLEALAEPEWLFTLSTRAYHTAFTNPGITMLMTRDGTSMYEHFATFWRGEPATRIVE